MSDYLWDGSGEPDPEVRELEERLAPLAHRGSPPEVEPRVEAAPEGRLPPMAVAAGLAVALAGILWAIRTAPDRTVATSPVGAIPGLRVERLSGRPSLGANEIARSGQLRAGQWLETDADSSALILLADVGKVRVHPSTRIRLVETGAERQELDLARGSIEAKVDAPPRLFLVGTPSATAVDLGCAYTLDVDDDGVGTLAVSAGRVALEAPDRTATVPAGWSCTTRPEDGPGTPVRGEAAPELRSALHVLDVESFSSKALDSVLEHATAEDALSLWHLLARVPADRRGPLLDRLATWIPALARYRSGLLQQDPGVLTRTLPFVLVQAEGGAPHPKVWKKAPVVVPSP